MQCTLGAIDASHASCQVTYTPQAVGSGSHFIGASYGGDGVHGATSASTRVGVIAANLRPSATNVSCLPQAVLIGEATTCTATVRDAGAGAPITPAGQVVFSSDGRGEFQGQFTSNGTLACTLSPTGAGQAGCQVSYTPTAINPFTLRAQRTDSRSITAAYQGGSHNPSQGSTTLASSLRPTATVLSCTPGSVAAGRRATCTVTVIDSAPGRRAAPQGLVIWRVDGSLTGELTSRQFTGRGSGGHVSDFCRLAPSAAAGVSSCELFFTPVFAGRRLLEVSFAGNDGGLTDNPPPSFIGPDQHAASHGKLTVSVFATPAQLAGAQGCIGSSAAIVADSQLPGGIGGDSTGDLAADPTIPTDFPVIDPGTVDGSAVASGPSLSGGLAVAGDQPSHNASTARRQPRQVTIASVHKRFTTTGRKHLRLVLSASARRQLRALARRHRGFRFTLILRYTPARGGPVQTARHQITIHAHRPPALLSLAHNHTLIRPGQKTVTLTAKLTPQARALLRQAAQGHKPVRFLVFVRIINPGGQTVIAAKTVTLATSHAHAQIADAGATTVTSCNPVPGPGIPPGTLNSEANIATAATNQLSTTDSNQTATQIINQGTIQLKADVNPLSQDLPTSVTLDTGADSRVSRPSATFTPRPPPVFAPPPPPLIPALGAEPLLGGGLAV